MCYVDDVLAITHDTVKTMDGVRRSFTLKNDKSEEPETCLGASLKKMATADGVECWTMSSKKYRKAAVQNVESTLDAHGRRLPSKCRDPLKSVYHPELDTTPELKADGVHQYQDLIGVLR